MVYRVEVTERDIECGFRKSTCQCPVARALLRALGANYITEIVVEEDRFHYRREDIPLPREVTEFIRRFDRRLRVEPFSFDLEIDPVP